MACVHGSLVIGEEALAVIAPVRALSLWTRLIDGQRAVAGLGAIEIGDCPSRRLVTGQFYKAKPLTLACVAICDQAYLVHLPIGGKQLGDLLLTKGVGEVTD